MKSNGNSSTNADANGNNEHMNIFIKLKRKGLYDCILLLSSVTAAKEGVRMSFPLLCATRRPGGVGKDHGHRRRCQGDKDFCMR